MEDIYVVWLYFLVGTISLMGTVASKSYKENFAELFVLAAGALIAIICALVWIFSGLTPALEVFAGTFVGYFLGLGLVKLIRLSVKKRTFLHRLISSKDVPFGPVLDTYEKKEIQYKDTELVIEIPSKLDSPDCFNIYNDEPKPLLFHKDYPAKAKTLSELEWRFYGDDRRDCQGVVSLSIELHEFDNEKLDGAPFNLFDFDDYSLALSQYCFVKYFFPGDLEGDYDEYRPVEFPIMENIFVSQDHGGRSGFSIKDNKHCFFHAQSIQAPISPRKLVVFHTNYYAYTENVKDQCISLTKHLLGTWSVGGSECANSESRSQFNKEWKNLEINTPKAPEEFSVEWLSTPDLRKFLLKHAEDPVKWHVFEHSCNYEGWFQSQYQKIRQRFCDRRLAYIQNNLSNYRIIK